MKVTTLQYAKTLLELTDGKSEQEVSDIISRFAQQLYRDGQIKNAKSIMEKFSQLYDKAHGIVNAEVVTRVKIEKDEQEKIEKFIKEKYSAKEVEIKNIIDEKIKGGIVIRVGDEIIDGSVATQLKRLKKALVSS